MQRTDAPPPALRQPRLVLAATVAASSLAFIDASVVNVGLPAIGRDLAASGAGLSWIVDAYLLPLGALLLVGGAAGDRYGRRRLLEGGIALFAAASLLCALAPGLPWLVAGRALQGVGAAALMPNSLAVLGAAFAGEARGRAVGTWAAVGAALGAAGPLAGGALIDTVGWRALFLVNLPIAAAALALARMALERDRPVGRGPLDLAGAAAAAAGLGLLAWGLTEASAARGLDPASVLAAVAGAAATAAFVRIERARGEGAMMPLALFASRGFVGLTLLTFLLYAALGGLLVLLPTVLISACGYSATAAGAAMLPLPAALALLSPRMGRLAGRIGPRLPLSLGPAMVAAGLALLVGIDPAGSYPTRVLPGLLVVSLGLAGTVAPLTAAVLGAVPPGRTGIASGLNSAVARAGGLVATALSTVVLAARGADLVASARAAALVGAAVALSAGLAGLALVPRRAGP